MDNIELTPEMLEIISGGVIGETEEDILTKMVRVFKNNGITLVDAKNKLFMNMNYETTALKNTNAEEVCAFLDANWDKIV